MLDALGLGAGERMAADEALVLDGGDDRALGRADVGDDAVGRRRVENLGDRRGQRAHGGGDHGRVGLGDRLAHGGAGDVDGAAVAGGAQHAVGGIEAGDPDAEPLARGQADGAADQPDSDDGKAGQLGARRQTDSFLPASAAAAWTRSA